jgi:hypothetical protein
MGDGCRMLKRRETGDGRPEIGNQMSDVRCQMSDVRCKIRKGLEDKSAGIPFRAREGGGNKECENLKRWVMGDRCGMMGDGCWCEKGCITKDLRAKMRFTKGSVYIYMKVRIHMSP